jgi:ribonuclease PH
MCFGNTRVICAATIQDEVPMWMKRQNVKGGWLTAEYSMLPYSTHQRKDRDSSRGKVDGRSTEIQRLIGRSLRAVVDLEKLGPKTLWIDCDVLQADGGTRCASITGGWVALKMAVAKLLKAGVIVSDPMIDHVAAVSCGIYAGQAVLDLDYAEDSTAGTDGNFILTGRGRLGILEREWRAFGALRRRGGS